MAALRLVTAGESHGPCEICIVEGIPAGLPIRRSDIDIDLERRQRGYGRGGRMEIEVDRCRFVAGVRQGKTLGSPICLVVENQDHVNWVDRMSADPPELPLEGHSSLVTLPRPGHADLGGISKYGHDDVRDVLERASARETTARVAAGAVCKRLLCEVGVTIRSRVVSIGEVSVSQETDWSSPASVDWDAVEGCPVGCGDLVAVEDMRRAIDSARAEGESLGGVLEVWCWGACPGLGSYATAEGRLDARLAGALVSIPAVKGVEIGPAFDNAAMRGSRVHDPLTVSEDGRHRRITRRTNRAGGIEGGMSTGMPIVVRAAMKPIPTLTSALPSVDIASLQPSRAHVERSDVTAVPAARVVGEAMVAYILAGVYLDKFGGDCLGDLLTAVRAYETRLEERGLWRRS